MYHTNADNKIRVNATSCMKGNSSIERMFIGGYCSDGNMQKQR